MDFLFKIRWLLLAEFRQALTKHRFRVAAEVYDCQCQKWMMAREGGDGDVAWASWQDHFFSGPDRKDFNPQNFSPSEQKESGA